MSTMKQSAPGPKKVTNELTVQKFNSTATNISGTANNLKAALSELETELKRDQQGKHDYEAMLKELSIKKADLQKRIDANQAWIDNFEKNDTAGAFEEQYRALVVQIETIYATAKEFHGKGIDMLIKEFNYHLAFKRWNDTFTATPFKPK